MPRARKKTKPLRFSKATRELVEEAREARAVATLQQEVIELRTKLVRVEKARLDEQTERRRYGSFFRYAPVPYVIFDGQGTVLEINRAAERLLEWRPTQRPPAPSSLFLLPGEFQRLLDQLHRKRSDVFGWTTLDLELVRSDGSRVEVQCAVGTDATHRGKEVYHAVLLNLTQFRQVERNLREALTGLRLAARAAGFGTFEYDVARRQMQWSTELRTILGLPASDLPVSMEMLAKIIHPEDRERAMRTMMHSLEPGGSGHYEDEHRLLLRNGQVRWVLARGRTYFGDEDGERQAVRAIGIVFDITHRKLAEEALRNAHGELERRVQERTEELRETNAQLRLEVAERWRLEQEILAVSDRERQRMGQDLHDGLGQQLTGIAIMQQSLQNALEQRKAAEAEMAVRIGDFVKQTRQELRRITRGLQPVSDEPLALMAGLEQICASWREHGIRCVFHCPEPVRIANPAVATHLFRIAQEGVGNAFRHGQSKKVTVSLLLGKKHLTLEVRDDGCGIPKDAGDRGGLGLRIMRSRAETIGGRIEIHRLPRRGTRMRCILPNTALSQNHATR